MTAHDAAEKVAFKVALRFIDANRRGRSLSRAMDHGLIKSQGFWPQVNK
jgi:hypothetical protein